MIDYGDSDEGLFSSDCECFILITKNKFVEKTCVFLESHARDGQSSAHYHWL